jgi:hypothetical protein
MKDTPQDPPKNDPASPVDDAPAITADLDSHQEHTDAAKTSESKKPWWKIWG